VIPKFPNGWLKRAIENCGFFGSRLIELESGETLEIDGIEIQIYRADQCDPQKCGVQIPCPESDPRISSIDSLALFQADGQRILNANDSLAVASVSRVFSHIKNVDLLLGHYGGAGPYPQCFEGIPEEEMVASASNMARSFLQRLAQATQSLNAKYVLPYAGQYLLGGNLSKLNKYRSVVSLSEALQYLALKTRARPIAMKPFSYFNLDDGLVGQEWQEPDESDIERYLAEISKTTFPYEKATGEWVNAATDVEAALHAVGREYLRQIPLTSRKSTHRISISSSRVSGSIEFNESNYFVTVQESELDPIGDDETRITLHPNLLRGLILRTPGYTGFTPLHFNQAEIGSHLTWYRKGAYDSVVDLLNFMQTSPSHLPHSKKQLA
jgi:UDP-MurNAc hydroxylase